MRKERKEKGENKKRKPRFKMRHKEALAGYLFSSPYLAGFLIFFAIPSAMSVYYCFTRGVGSFEFAGLDNFKSVIASNSYRPIPSVCRLS